MQLAFLASGTGPGTEGSAGHGGSTAPSGSSTVAASGWWWHDAPRRRSPDEPSLDEFSDPALVPPEVRRAAVAWFGRVQATPVHARVTAAAGAHDAPDARIA